jgi:hypothetical protein
MQEIAPCNKKESGRQHPHHLTFASLNAAWWACCPVKYSPECCFLRFFLGNVSDPIFTILWTGEGAWSPSLWTNHSQTPACYTIWMSHLQSTFTSWIQMYFPTLHTRIRQLWNKIYYV